jgi:hypothetical protein
MRRSAKSVHVSCDHAGFTHFGGVFFFQEFLRVMQIRRYLAQNLTYRRPHSRYTVSQMILALIYPVILGLDRLETASLLRCNGVFQYLTGLPSFPDPQTLRRFLLQAPQTFWHQLHRLNDGLLQDFIHRPDHRSRLILDLDSTVVTVFGHQEGAAVGYNPHYRGKRSYNPLLCIEANSSYLWDVDLRSGDASSWGGSVELLDSCFANVPDDMREIRVRADAGFGFHPVLEKLERHRVQYAVVARLTKGLKRQFPGLSYQPFSHKWELADFEYRPQDWPVARRFVVARRLVEEDEAETTLFAMGRYVYRAWVTNLPLSPGGIWHFYDGRAAMEPRIAELRENFALRKVPTRSFLANALFLEIIRLAYNLVTCFQRTCLPESMENLTLQKLRHKLLLLPAQLVRPQNRSVLRLPDSAFARDLSEKILGKVATLKPLKT